MSFTFIYPIVLEWNCYWMLEAGVTIAALSSIPADKSSAWDPRYLLSAILRPLRAT